MRITAFCIRPEVLKALRFAQPPKAKSESQNPSGSFFSCPKGSRVKTLGSVKRSGREKSGARGGSPVGGATREGKTGEPVRDDYSSMTSSMSMTSNMI